LLFEDSQAKGYLFTATKNVNNIGVMASHLLKNVKTRSSNLKKVKFLSNRNLIKMPNIAAKPHKMLNNASKTFKKCSK